MKRVHLIHTALVLLSFATSASGQTTAKGADNVAIGVDLSVKGSTGADSHGGTTVGLTFKLGRPHEGWGFKHGLGWYTAHLNTSIGSQRVDFGALRVRPLMAGYGYTKAVGTRTHVSANVLAGLAVTSFSLSPNANSAFRSSFAASEVRTDATNPFVLKPEISTWIRATERMSVNISAGYVIARPRITIAAPHGTEERRIRADMFTLRFGAVYYIF
jgi:hypothetical protein